MSELVRRTVLNKKFWPGVAMAALIGGSLSVAGVATADTVDDNAEQAAEDTNRGGRDDHHGNDGAGVHSEADGAEFHEVCDGAGPGGAFEGPCPVAEEGGAAAVGGAPEELATTGPSEDLALVGGAIALTGGVVMYMTRRRREAVSSEAAE
ncbi:hypothetical protein [Nocardiopsis sp. LOL_012]|uniref:hypothetical protein n=1 Tax=Nocardiopsis sp. LOL_012 TaxID=3345409 RepID=UPI003A890A81